MLKRRGNFPYDFDAFYPAYPTPVMPPGYHQNPAPPPAAIPEPQPAAAPPPLPADTQPPVEASQPATPVSPTDTQPPPTAPAPEPSARIPHHRRKIPTAASPKNLPPAVPDPNESAASRHARKCTICNHPDRDAIDDDYINWIRPLEIAFDYDVAEQNIRRHARATGLDDLRLAKYHPAVHLLIENAKVATVTGDTVLRAIRAVSSFHETGKWVEPPKQVLFTVQHVAVPAIPPPPDAPAPPPQADNPVLELAPPITSDAVLIEHQGD